MLIAADDHLLVGSVNLDHVERRSGRDAEALALADSEVVNAGVLADHFSVRGHKLAGRVGQSLATLGEGGINEALVIAAGDKADLLRIGLLGQSQTLPAGQFANLGLRDAAER